MDCLFCKIIAGKIPAKLVYESQQIIAFPDIHPAADLHILIVPKEHIRGIKEIGEERGSLMVEVVKAALKIVIDNGLEEDSYRVLVNGGKAQRVPHLHFHLLGGKWNKMV